MARAISSLPVPLSPEMKHAALGGRRHLDELVDAPHRLRAAHHAVARAVGHLLGVGLAARAAAGARMRSSTSNSRSRETGFSRKSVAPTRMASTASVTLPWPEITTTGVPGAWRCSSRSTSMPVPSGSFRSSRTAAGRLSAKSRRPSPHGGRGDGPVAARLQQLHADLCAPRRRRR